ncbi:ferritin family protein [Chloroflexota bacterium]
MGIEEDKTLQAVQTAIKMEIDGREYYAKASQESGNELGRQLLQKLADEEDIHRRKFEQIYDTFRLKKGWPVVTLETDEAQSLRTIFKQAVNKLGAQVKILDTELGAVQKAMEMENKTYDFYQKRTGEANYAAERDFYGALMIQERGHHQALMDYYDYLKDPAGYFVRTEHPSLDGG